MPRHRKNDENNVLRLLRSKAGLTQVKAAKAVGVARTTWSSWELRERPMSVAYLNRVHHELSLTDEETRILREWWGSSGLDDADETSLPEIPE